MKKQQSSMVTGKFCSKNGGGVETEKPDEKRETLLSGLYIRSLVKQLRESRGTKENSGEDRDGEGGKARVGPEIFQPTKKVRRRTRARRPYQESLVNTAEARREIVKALKLHRAAMEKQARPEAQTPDPESHWRVSSSSSADYFFSSAPVVRGNLDFVLPIKPSLSPGSGGEFSVLRPESDELFSFPFAETKEFPAWLDANDDVCLQHLSDCSSHLDVDCLQDTHLPWMDIEEMEGMEGDWLA